MKELNVGTILIRNFNEVNEEPAVVTDQLIDGKFVVVDAEGFGSEVLSIDEINSGYVIDLTMDYVGLVLLYARNVQSENVDTMDNAALVLRRLEPCMKMEV